MTPRPLASIHGPLRSERNDNKPRRRRSTAGVVPRLVAEEVGRGNHRIRYRVRDDGGMVAESDAISHEQALRDVVTAWLLPAGFPASCDPQVGPYMFWRSVQYAFGGAISVLTTRSLLTSLGVAKAYAGETSAAINWVIKDGAGRMGRALFARIGGRSLDDKAKQWRLLGDGLMFAGAVGELSTSMLPQLFLPIACAANVAKNMAVVAASATRAPIYRTFALQNNLADITAKGESIANLSDVVGTAFGILLTRSKRVSTFPAFALLSAGYLISSRLEVATVQLPYFNKARLGLAIDEYLRSGTVPSIKEINAREPMLPWNPKYLRTTRVILGASIAEACDGAEDLERALADTPASSNSVLTYRSIGTKKGRKRVVVYVMLKRRPGSGNTSRTHAAYEGCFKGLILQHVLDRGASFPPRSRAQRAWERVAHGGERDFSQLGARFVAEHSHELFLDFDRKARSMGWKTRLTTLNTKESRLLVS